MSEILNKRIRLIYGIVLSASLLVAGGCLIMACIGIYRSGDQPFSRESVAQAFQGISLMIYICLALIAGGFILSLCLPALGKKSGFRSQYAMQLHRLHVQKDLRISGATVQQDVKKLQTGRAIHRGVCLGLLVFGSAVFLSYALDGTNFHPQDINGSMVRAMMVLLPCMALPCCYAIIASYLAQKSMAQEIRLMRDYAAARTAPTTEKDPETALRAVRWGLLALAVCAAAYGLFAGGTLDVLTKAINICTECVGLG